MGLMSYVGKQFHKPTGLFGRIATFTMNRQNQAQYRGVERALALEEPDTVLEIGFGNGYLLERFASRYGCRLFGVDISEDMIELVARRCRQLIADGQVSLVLGDAQDTGLESASFDKVYTINTIYFWSDLEAGLAEIRRVLKPGGVLALGFYPKETLDRVAIATHGYHKYHLEELVGSIEQAGFVVSATQLSGHNLAYCLTCVKQ